MHITKVLVFGELCIYDPLVFSSFSINDEPNLWYVMNDGATRDIDPPVFTSCMFSYDMSYTYTFRVNGNLISWVTYDSGRDKIVATVTQQQIDEYCGTSLDTYSVATVQVDVEVVPTYNADLSGSTSF